MTRERATVGLCDHCAFAQRVLSARGSVFWLCRRALSDPAFARYPRLPMLHCSGYEHVKENQDKFGRDDRRPPER